MIAARTDAAKKSVLKKSADRRKAIAARMHAVKRQPAQNVQIVRLQKAKSKIKKILPEAISFFIFGNHKYSIYGDSEDKDSVVLQGVWK